MATNGQRRSRASSERAGDPRHARSPTSHDTRAAVGPIRRPLIASSSQNGRAVSRPSARPIPTTATARPPSATPARIAASRPVRPPGTSAAATGVQRGASRRKAARSTTSAAMPAKATVAAPAAGDVMTRSGSSLPPRAIQTRRAVAPTTTPASATSASRTLVMPLVPPTQATSQWPPCPPDASTALRCSAMTFSATCDGTSS